MDAARVLKIDLQTDFGNIFSIILDQSEAWIHPNCAGRSKFEENR